MDKDKVYFVSPDGHLVEASRNAKPKAGWRIATQEDWDIAAEIEAERKSAEGHSAAPRGPLAK